jgi:tagaturonate epimerase
MEKWEKVCSIPDEIKLYNVYPDSIYHYGGTYFFLASIGNIKKLVVYNGGGQFYGFKGTEVSHGNKSAVICDLNNDNCKLIRKIFTFTNPTPHRGVDITLGLGDRLGLASAGHIRLLKGKAVFPVLAQQSIRELNLTGRTYEDVLAAASWAVFQEGYTSGFGADGDHLKNPDEVKMAIDIGFTMITLDCSEHIDNTIASLSKQEIDSRYLQIAEETRHLLESKYLNKEFKLKSGHAIKFSYDEFEKYVLIYLKAIEYTIKIYDQYIKNCGRDIDFEMSIDETLTSTSPEAHYFVASELLAGGVEITSLAPRFCGEFQKGIDYIGDISEFKKEFNIHAEIAKTLGYKISIHSGSDKFSVFPIIGEMTEGKYHLKTAGTNWLEAVRIIAAKNPALYRKLHRFALEKLDEAKKYYHIGANAANIPNIEKLEDCELPGLMDLNDSRQVLHITYGLILLAKNPDGTFIFKDEIYSVLNEYEEDYYTVLYKHIGRHLHELGVR